MRMLWYLSTSQIAEVKQSLVAAFQQFGLDNAGGKGNEEEAKEEYVQYRLAFEDAADSIDPLGNHVLTPTVSLAWEHLFCCLLISI